MKNPTTTLLKQLVVPCTAKINIKFLQFKATYFIDHTFRLLPNPIDVQYQLDYSRAANFCNNQKKMIKNSPQEDNLALLQLSCNVGGKPIFKIRKTGSIS